MKRLIFILTILLVPIVCLSQLPGKNKLDSLEMILNSDRFNIQFYFDPRQVDADKDGFVYHVISYDRKEGEVFSTYYRQKYMDGELTLVGEKKVYLNDFQKLKDWIMEDAMSNYELDRFTYAVWDGPRRIARMYILNENIQEDVVIYEWQKPWILEYLNKLK